MAEQLVNISVYNPGTKGLNTESSVLLDPSWGEELVDWIFNGLSELQAREGYQSITNISTITAQVKSIYEYTDDSNVTRIIFSAGNKIYSVDNLGNVTDVTGSATITGDNWQFVTFNGQCIGYQEGHTPIFLPNNSSTFAHPTGTHYQGPMVHSSGGRLWTVYNNTLYYSDLLVNDFGTGSAGSFDLDIYWPKGNDRAVAIVEHNNYLIVFGKESILIYSNPNDVANMTLVDTIAGVGCIARDSVVPVGMDLAFLSNIGVVSFGRVIQEKSLPSVEMSRNIRKDMLRVIGAESNKNDIKAAYFQDKGLYTISFPASKITYVIETTQPLEDGSHRVLSWSIYPTAIAYSVQRSNLVFSQTVGQVQTFTGTKDGVAFDGSGGTDRKLVYKSNWTVLHPELESNIKIVKQMAMVSRGSADYVTLGIAYDFLATFYEVVASNTSTVDISRFGRARFGISTFNGLFDQQYNKVQMRSSGYTVQLKIDINNPSKQYILKRIDVKLKVGRLT